MFRWVFLWHTQVCVIMTHKCVSFTWGEWLPHVQLRSEFTTHFTVSLVLNLVPGIVSGTKRDCKWTARVVVPSLPPPLLLAQRHSQEPQSSNWIRHTVTVNVQVLGTFQRLPYPVSWKVIFSNMSKKKTFFVKNSGPYRWNIDVYDTLTSERSVTSVSLSFPQPVNR